MQSDDDENDTDDLLEMPSGRHSDMLSAKERIVGAITWERVANDLNPRQALVQLTLIGCRTKYQGLGVASRLMREVKNPKQVWSNRS